MDATGLELLARSVRERVEGADAVSTNIARGEATLEIAPSALHPVMSFLKGEADEPWEVLTSVHGCDYYPEEPRLGVHYMLLSMARAERLGVKTRVRSEAPTVRSVVDLFPGANFQEREIYDFFGVDFEGHPDPRRIHMPEDYEGHPQRRDFPIGGEPVIFTFNEPKMPRWYA